jgi:hypothetical protein
MTKIELMQALAEIPGDYPIMAQVPTDEISDGYDWMMMKCMSIEGVKEVYQRDEYVFTDIDDLRDHLECFEDVTIEETIQQQIELTPHKKMIVIEMGL